jgi:TonB-dependent starch-binding outer membrane protein SusC
MKKKLLILFIALGVCFSFLANFVYSQEKGEIKGKIKDEKGEDVIGANIVLSGTKFGANSNVDGRFIIKNIPASEYTLIVRYVGYKQDIRKIILKKDESLTLDITLQTSAVQMNEVVSTGQGAAIEKKKLPTTIETLSLREIETNASPSIDQLLQGTIPGLLSYVPSGLPGTGARMSTRGIKSALLSSNPVIYIDGVKVDIGSAFRLQEDNGGMVSSAFSDLVIGDIERIEVIKGGAASTLYGSEAANGVIQIFTKRGLSGGVMPGAPKWKFSVTSGSDVPELRFTKDQLTKDKYYRDSYYQGYKMNVIGGNDRISFNLSGSMNYNNGVVVQDKLKDRVYNLFSGMRAVLGERSDIQVSANYVRKDYAGTYVSNAIFSPLGAFEQGTTFQDSSNPDSLINLYFLPKITTSVNRFIYSTNINYSPFDFWLNKFTFGVDYRKNEERAFAPKESEAIVVQEGGYLHRSDRENMTITMNYTGSLKLPDLGPVTQTLSLGAQGFRVEDRESQATGDNFAIPGTEDFDNASIISAQESNRQIFSGGVYMQDQITAFDNIFVDLGIRFDGNSTFGKDIGIQTYPKAGIAYAVSDESYYPEFIKEYMGSFKLRGSWGMTGNFPPPFTRDRTYSSTSFFDNAALNFLNPGDKDLKPEKTSSIEFGFDAGFWDDRVSLEFSYFDQTTKDALFSVPSDPASGFLAQYKNIGEISNKGIELSLKADILQMKNVDLAIHASLATLKNKVVSMGGSSAFSIAGFSFAPMRVMEGYPIGVWRLNVPIKEANGTYAGNYTPNVYMGNPLPKETGSFGLDLTLFKNLSISGYCEFAFGHNILNLLTILRYLNGCPDAASAIPVSTNPAKQYSYATAASVFLEKADWIKLRDITVRYAIPDILFRGITLVLSCRNLTMFGIKSGVDPEQSWNTVAGQNLQVGGLGGECVSAPKQIRFTIEVNL